MICGGWYAKKWLSRGAIRKKQVKRGGHVKYSSKTLKWHDLLTKEVLEFKAKREQKIGQRKEGR